MTHAHAHADIDRPARLDDFGIVSGMRTRPWATAEDTFRAVGYEPYRQQRQFHHVREFAPPSWENVPRIRVVAGAKRIGKSFMGARDVLPLVATPETRGWIVGVTYKRAIKEFEYIHHDTTQTLGFGTLEDNFNVRGGYMFLRFAHNATAEVRSAKDEHDLEAEACDWIILAEPAQHKESTFELCRERLSEKRGTLLLVGTPPPDRHWLKKIFDRGQDPSWEDYWSIQIPATETPYPGLDEVAKLERELSPRRLRRDVLAEFIATEKNIYPTFEYVRHVDDLEYDPRLPLFWTFDFGAGHPWVCLWVQVDLAARHVYVLREYYQTRTSDRDNILAVKREHKATGWKRTEWNAGDPRAASARLELEAHGVELMGDESLRDGSKDRGIEKVQQLLDGEDGRPLLTISRSCENLIDECSLYHRDDNGKIVNRDDDGLDALRYLVMELWPDEDGSEAGLRWVDWLTRNAAALPSGPRVRSGA